MFREQLELFLHSYEKEIEDSARELLEQEMPSPTEELFSMYEKTGNRLKYEAVYFARRRMLAVLGMRVILGSDAEWSERQIYLHKLEQVMTQICGEECWALPAHVDRAHNPHWRVTVDLFASETAQTLSDLLDQLGEDISQDVRNMVTENIERRIFQPFFTSQVPYGHWEGSDNNWNAVCAGSIGSACLHLMKEQPGRLKDCLERLLDSLTYYIKGFSEDGACMEGLGYYYYGMAYFVNFAQELYEAIGGATDLFCGEWGDFAGGKEDRRYKIAHFPVKCFFADGKSLSFSDGDADGWFRVGIHSALARHYGNFGADEKDARSLEEGSVAELFPDMSRAAGLHSDSCYRFASLKMDLIETRRLLEAMGNDQAEWEGQEKGSAVGESEVHILPSAQWYVARSRTGVGFACKGGHNNEPHNHNDLGHFIYEGRGELFFTDLGAGEYTKDYFSEKRYQILCNNSFGHSVPVVNGKGQESGERYRCSRFSADGEGCVGLELHEAYPEGLLEGFLRKFSFDPVSGKLLLSDRLALSHPGEEEQSVVENLVTQIPPVIEGDQVLLKTEKGMCVLSVGARSGAIEIREYEHSNHQGVMEKVYGIRWPVAVDSRGVAECDFSVTVEWA